MTDFSDYGFRNYRLVCALPIRIREELRFYDPDVSTNDPKQIAYFESIEKRKRGLRTSGKPGKFLRRFLDNDVEVEDYTRILRENYLCDPGSFQIRSGNTREVFKKIFTAQLGQQIDPRCHEFKKLLHCSCMRYEFSGSEAHPSEAYASGDFEIYWVEDEAKRVCSRSVVSTTGFYAPIYTVTDGAYELLKSHFETLGFRQAEYGSWVGLSLLAIGSVNNRIGPYFDIGPKSLDENLVISRNGCYEASSTSGYLCYDAYRDNCPRCGDDYDEDDGVHIEGEGETWCSYCADNYAFSSDYDGELYHINTSVTIYRVDHHNEAWTDDQASNYARYCEHTGDYWHPDDATEVFDGTFVNNQDLYDEYTCSDHSGEWFPSNTMIEVEGETWHEDEPAVLCVQTHEYFKPDNITETPLGPISTAYLETNPILELEMNDA